MPLTSNILMIRPVRFGYNVQTAVNNAFQVKGNQENVQAEALKEFDDFVQILTENGINVLVVNDTEEPHTPDSIFPNNWLSFHENGSIVHYPMFAENRRQERKDTVIKAVADHFNLRQTLDLSGYEQHNMFLEGTGSMVLDRDNKLVYACLSPRTNETVLAEFCKKAYCQSIVFTAKDQLGQAIYHTNVMMCIADQYVVICLDAITDESEKKMVTDSFENTGKKVITISFEQMNHFAGNMLQLVNKNGQKFLVMSTQAFQSLSPAQIALLESFNPILHSNLQTIETNGGGSARCMMAEVFLSEH
jgi:hypothetical protein